MAPKGHFEINWPLEHQSIYFQQGIKKFGPKLFEQSIFEASDQTASDAPKQWEETISKKRRSFHWFSRNSELEATWINLIGRTHKKSTTYSLCTLLLFKNWMICFEKTRHFHLNFKLWWETLHESNSTLKSLSFQRANQ